MPVSWRLWINRTSLGVQKLQLADHLLAVWSGVYDVSTVDQYQLATVAAPRVIQAR
jgi:hypothetical protein